MPDRNDKSQPDSGYSAAFPDWEPPTSTVQDTQTLTSAHGYATGDELARYLGTTEGHDGLADRPGDTFAQYVTTVTEYAEWREVNRNGVILTMPAQLAGWNFIELSTGLAVFRINLRDGLDVSAPIVASITNTNNVFFPPIPIRLRYGLYAELVNAAPFTGLPYGTAYFRTVRAD